MQGEARARRTVAADTRRRGIASIARDQIVPLAKLVIEHAMQPIVEVETGRVYGHEALMRGHDRLGVDEPTDLLDLAAEAGEISRLERMLHARALARFSLIEGEGEKLFLNLDGRALDADLTFLEDLAGAIGRSGVLPSSVVIELSERHDHLSNPVFPEFMTRLKALGLRVAIDDFGIGFSELRLLCDYGVDYIKLDGHFVHGSGEDRRKRLFVATMTNFAHVLGVRVVAEGVENVEDYLAVREAGCDLVQGWFAARPTIDTGALQRIYAHVPAARTRLRRDRSSDELLVRSEMRILPAIPATATLDEVFDLFRNHPSESFFPVIDAGGCPRGIVHERDLKQYIYSPFGRDLLRNRGYYKSFINFVTPCPMADVETDAGRMLEIFTHARGADCVVVTENLRYLGVLSAAALIKVMSEKQIRTAQDQNPLTELPGNLSITDFVAGAALDGERVRHFCYFDFDHFKPFNDRYGFAQGDKAIRLFADAMRRRLGLGAAFLGHVGGDDFFAGFVGSATEEVRAVVSALLADFRRDVAELYPEEDRLAGGIDGVDRAGRPYRCPLMRCSAAVVVIPVGSVSAEQERVGRFIASAKTASKHSAEGMVVVHWGAGG